MNLFWKEVIKITAEESKWMDRVLRGVNWLLSPVLDIATGTGSQMDLFRGLKFFLQGYHLPSIGVQHVVCRFLSSDWLLTESLLGIQSSSLRETDMIIDFTSAGFH